VYTPCSHQFSEGVVSQMVNGLKVGPVEPSSATGAHLHFRIHLNTPVDPALRVEASAN
jgi:hypothetical protein